MLSDLSVLSSVSRRTRPHRSVGLSAPFIPLSHFVVESLLRRVTHAGMHVRLTRVPLGNSSRYSRPSQSRSSPARFLPSHHWPPSSVSSRVPFATRDYACCCRPPDRLHLAPAACPALEVCVSAGRLARAVYPSSGIVLGSSGGGVALMVLSTM